MKSITEQRIEEYNEEIVIIEKGIDVYTRKFKLNTREDYQKFQDEYKLFDLKMKLKAKIAAVAQLTEDIKKNAEQMKKDVKAMKEHWHNALKLAMDMKGKFSRDHKLQVESIKDTHIRKIKLTDEVKVFHYKTLLNLINRYSNGKSV